MANPFGFGSNSAYQQMMEQERKEMEYQLLRYQQMQASNYQSVNSPAYLQYQQLINSVSEAPTKTSVDTKKLEALKAATPRKVLRPTPDYIAPLVAWRAWKAEGGKLHALGVTSVWEPKKAVEATCNHGSNHESPQSKCECGIWAFKTLELLTPALEPYEVRILGQVSLWGRVIETENGFRAQYAYPKELWLLDESLEQLGYVYGVPVRMVTA